MDMLRKYLFFLILALPLGLAAQTGTRIEGRGVWAHPSDFGKSEKDVEDVFKVLKKANIQIVVPLVKDMTGRVYWQSKRFPEAVHPDYRDFDLLRAITNVAPKYGIKVHAWLCDFPEGKDSPAFKAHPEWAMLNPQGGLTSEEKLTPDQAYGPVWMCPNRRPGYTDQWLLPMIEEVVRDYPVDGIHHDYVCYPGDVAPDSYCFCDYCLEHFLSDNLFYYPSRPDVQIPLKKVRLREESNWDLDFTVKPSNWTDMSREEKAKFILEGKSINRPDLDYFFYELRCDAISRFVREAWEKASAIRPGIEMSAAVFINPMKSGRFIAQRWTDFTPWVDIAMTMTYRSHFQGSFEDYLTYLADVVRAQNRWVEETCSLLVGLDAHYIFREELEPWEQALSLLNTGRALESKEKVDRLIRADIAYLRLFSGPRAKELSARYSSFLKGQLTPEALAGELSGILADPPPRFFPEAKLIQTIETVRQAGGPGVIIFAASQLTRKKLWGAVEKAFSFPSSPSFEVIPAGRHLSIKAWKELWRESHRSEAKEIP
jgi:uncharacterized lipoprotein YddW (UPF0748 family)